MKKLLKILVLIITVINLSSISLIAQNNDSIKINKIKKLFFKSSSILNKSPKQAINISHQILNLTNNDSLKFYIPFVYRIIGIAYLNLSIYDSSKYYLNLALEKISASKDTANTIYILNNLGIVYLESGNYNKALTIFTNAYNYYITHKDSTKIAPTLVNMSITAKNLFEYETALNYQIEVLNHYKKFLDSIALASSYNNMANLYKKVGNYQLALKYYNSAMDIYKIKKMQKELASVDNNIGIIYKLQKNYKKALDYYEESLRIDKEFDNKFGISLTLNNMAEVYELQQKYDYAITFFQQSLILKKEIDYKKGIINSLVNIGRVYFKAGKYKKSKEYLLRAVKLGGKSYLSLSEAYLYLSKISKKEGKIIQSLDYLEDYAEIQDSVVNPARNKRINNIISNFELAKKDTTIQNLLDFEKESQEMISRSNSYIYGLALILIIILIISFVFFKQLKVVSKLQNERDKKNKELEKTNDELKKTMNKLNTEIQERLKAEAEIKSTREQLKELYKKEKEINDMKTRLISNITHEYRNPLTSISLKTGLLKEEMVRNNPEIYFRQITAIEAEIDKMIKLLDDALTYNQGASGLQKVNFERLDLFAFCNELVKSTLELHFNDHKITVNSNIKGKFMVNSDKLLLDTILTNLLDNAFKYSPKNTTITFEIIDNRNNFTIKIKDDGIGIPEEDKQWLGKPFHRCRNVGNISGNGLGLSIVKSNVELLKGEFTFESIENKGSEFSFTLPKVIQ